MKSRLEFWDYLVQILESNIKNHLVFFLDSLKFDLNKVNQFSYPQSPLDTFF